DPVATGTTNVTGAYDAFLIKLDSSGVFSWGRHFYGSNTSSEKLNSIAVTGDGDVFMTGQARLLINMKDHNGNLITTINPTASNTNNALDIYLYRLNTNGGLEMSTHIGGTVGGYNSPSTPPNYEAGTHLNIHGGYLYLSANTTIANRLDAQKIDFNPAPFTINGLTDYLSNINETITATLTKYFVCTDNSSVSFLSSIVSTCPNNYLQYIPNPNNSNYSYQWNCSSLGISSDSAILKIANPSAALGGKVMNLQMTDVNGCYKHVYAPIDGSALSAPSVSLTSSITDLCNGDTYTCTATGSNVKWYANATDTIPVASGNTYSYTPVLQQTTAMAIYAATTNTVTGCEDPRAVHSFTVGVIPQTYIDSTQSGPFVGCANGQSRYVQVITPLNLFAKIYPDSLSNTQIGFTNSWWDLGSHYDLTIPDTITVWIETEGTIGQPSIPCGSIRFPLTFILNDCSVTAISESSINSNVFKIYPNPANDVITINYDGLKETNSSIEIINTVGQTLIKQDVANETSQNINVSNLSNGIYFVQIKQNGKSIATKKLVINK
ncbi:MAG: T9SS type A sorting domain-containing protein, partial [Bacteroidia bacterium]|nr:T9SS type A sorting domain-containing protein [Bacteroidia bacterium]